MHLKAEVPVRLLVGTNPGGVEDGAQKRQGHLRGEKGQMWAEARQGGRGVRSGTSSRGPWPRVRRRRTYQRRKHVDNLAVVNDVDIATLDGRRLGVFKQLGLVARVDHEAVHPGSVAKLRAALQQLGWGVKGQQRPALSRWRHVAAGPLCGVFFPPSFGGEGAHLLCV